MAKSHSFIYHLYVPLCHFSPLSTLTLFMLSGESTKVFVTSILPLARLVTCIVLRVPAEYKKAFLPLHPSLPPRSLPIFTYLSLSLPISTYLCVWCFNAHSPEDEHVVRESLNDTLPSMLHSLMFVPNVEALCDEQQQQYWLPRCKSMEVKHLPAYVVSAAGSCLFLFFGVSNED